MPPEAIQGAKVLEARLALLERKVAGKIARQTVRSSAKIVQTEVQRRVSLISTRLAAAGHKVRAVKKTRGTRGITATGVHQPPREVLGIDPKDKYYWPAVVEYGAKKLGRKNARPYMRPALAAKQKEVVAHTSKMLKDEIVKASRV